jgi:hypothetical protein
MRVLRWVGPVTTSTATGTGSWAGNGAWTGAGNAYNASGTGSWDANGTWTGTGSGPPQGGGGVRYDQQTIDRMARAELHERLLREDEELCLLV